VAQEDYSIANQAGAAFRTDLNNHLAAIVSNNSGATAPSTTFAYEWWADTTTGLLKIRNAANSGWVTVGTLSATNFGLTPLASPTFTGTPAAPTATADTNTTQLATTAFVIAQAGSATPLVNAATAVVGTSKRYARQDHVHPGPGLAASQAEMEAASSNLVTVTPSGMKYHPGVAKAWVAFNGTGTVAILGSYNVSSITDNGTGRYTINFSSNFSSDTYVPVGFCTDDDNTGATILTRNSTDTLTVSACAIKIIAGVGGGAVDSPRVFVAFFGDF
jgi:hypothetical protein